MLDLRRPKDVTDMTISEVDEWIDKDEPELTSNQNSDQDKNQNEKVQKMKVLIRKTKKTKMQKRFV